MVHYYDSEQKSPLSPEKIKIVARGVDVDIWSGSGVFSRSELDKGTQLLLDTCVVEEGWLVHDLGCGNGVVSVVIGTVFPTVKIIASDVSKRACKLTRMNSKEHGLDLDVRNSDGYEKIDETFDTVLLNPPYVAGRKVVFGLIEDASNHLKKGGLLQVVARHNKGGGMIMKKMEELFGNCDDSRKQSGFRVYLSKK